MPDTDTQPLPELPVIAHTGFAVTLFDLESGEIEEVIAPFASEMEAMERADLLVQSVKAENPHYTWDDDSSEHSVACYSTKDGQDIGVICTVIPITDPKGHQLLDDGQA